MPKNFIKWVNSKMMLNPFAYYYPGLHRVLTYNNASPEIVLDRNYYLGHVQALESQVPSPF